MGAELLHQARSFAEEINNSIGNINSRQSLDAYTMNESDVLHWFGQFEFTDEVLAQISKDEFYDKLRSWASEASETFFQRMKGVDRVEVAGMRFRSSDEPGLRINRSVDMVLSLYTNEAYVGDLHITMLECRGQLKLIKVL